MNDKNSDRSVNNQQEVNRSTAAHKHVVKQYQNVFLYYDFTTNKTANSRWHTQITLRYVYTYIFYDYCSFIMWRSLHFFVFPVYVVVRECLMYVVLFHSFKRNKVWLADDDDIHKMSLYRLYDVALKSSKERMRLTRWEIIWLRSFLNRSAIGNNMQGWEYA